MKVSDAILALSEVLTKHGDLDIFIDSNEYSSPMQHFDQSRLIVMPGRYKYLLVDRRHSDIVNRLVEPNEQVKNKHESKAKGEA